MSSGGKRVFAFVQNARGRLLACCMVLNEHAFSSQVAQSGGWEGERRVCLQTCEEECCQYLQFCKIVQSLRLERLSGLSVACFYR